jgi:hypothetical protein
MGFHVSTLYNLPTDRIRHFVHVLDLSGGLHAKWIEENLHNLARSFGPNAGLVTGPQDLTLELHQFLLRNVNSDFGPIEKLLHSATCLVISDGHLTTTTAPVFVLPLATTEDPEAAHEMIDTLLRMLGTAARADRVPQLVESLGALRISLAGVGGTIVVCTLRELNKVVDLKPNVAGFGVNLNAIVERLLPPSERVI